MTDVDIKIIRERSNFFDAKLEGKRLLFSTFLMLLIIGILGLLNFSDKKINDIPILIHIVFFFILFPIILFLKSLAYNIKKIVVIVFLFINGLISIYLEGFPSYGIYFFILLAFISVILYENKIVFFILSSVVITIILMMYF